MASGRGIAQHSMKARVRQNAQEIDFISARYLATEWLDTIKNADVLFQPVHRLVPLFRTTRA
jgi:hypothetical protein